MSPQTVNAYYNPTQNEIVFPAGILQKPFFGHESMAENLGSIGVVIGHEMSHGFDDQGRKYNKKGELKEWWSTKDCTEFSKRAKIVQKHYDTLKVYDSKINGELTLGENIADIGGLKLALRALRLYYGKDKGEDQYNKFFHAYAKIWCMNIRKKNMQ
uniref:Peptidase M13 C-terminal domain-containing protein n=1 Tax=viral metagenome TaxID=1070528 RepID=A0A6C0J465_9ZZZZ